MWGYAHIKDIWKNTYTHEQNKSKNINKINKHRHTYTDNSNSSVYGRKALSFTRTACVRHVRHVHHVCVAAVLLFERVHPVALHAPLAAHFSVEFCAFDFWAGAWALRLGRPLLGRPVSVRVCVHVYGCTCACVCLCYWIGTRSV